MGGLGEIAEGPQLKFKPPKVVVSKMMAIRTSRTSFSNRKTGILQVRGKKLHSKVTVMKNI